MKPKKTELIPIPEYEPTLYFGNNHWKPFASLISKAEKYIKIMTGSISDTALSLLLSYNNRNVDIEIITRRGRGYDNIFLLKNVNVDKFKRCRRLHGKFCIIDGTIMISGSSNITSSSLGDNRDRSGFFEADIITEEKDKIRSAEYLFDIVWNEKSDIGILKNESGFISSAFGVPLKITECIKDSQEEIIIIVPAFLSSTISVYIRELNSKVKLKIITSHQIREKEIEGLKKIKTLENTEVILVRNRIHSKVYIFDGRIAIISSINLTFTSLVSSLETGLIIKDNNILQKVKKTIDKLENNKSSLKIIPNDGNGGEEPSEIDIKTISFLFETEGKKIIDDLKIRMIYTQNREKIIQKAEKGTISSIPKPKRKPEVIYYGPKHPIKVKKQKNFKNLEYWTIPQLKDYAEKNGIPLVNNKHEVIKNIEDSNPKETPRLYFVQNLLKNEHIFRKYVGLIIGFDELIDMGCELEDHYISYHFTDTDSLNLWYDMSYFLLKSKNRKFILDLLEQKLAKKEHEIKEFLGNLINKDYLLSIFPELEEKEEVKKEEKKILRKIKPFIRAIFYKPELFKKVITEFRIKRKLIELLRKVDPEKYKLPSFSLDYLFNELYNHLDNQIVNQKLENLFVRKKYYIIRLIENEHEKERLKKFSENKCLRCKTIISSDKILCTVCASLLKEDDHFLS